jgi:hypothetical protein
MVRIFDLPPGGLVDGKIAQEVNADGSSVEQSRISRKDAVNSQPEIREIIHGGEVRDIFVKDSKEDVKGFQTPTEENPAGSNAGGMAISMRPKIAVNLMRVEFPLDIITELNDHIDNELIPNGKDASGGLVGQINRTERSAQITLPHVDDEVGEQFSSVLCRVAKEYMKHTIGTEIECDTDMQTMWTIHSYEGDYNPVHDHGTRTSMGLSCILYLKVPPQIEALDNPAEDFQGLNNASGAIDGFTYLCWGTNGMRDINMLRPITEEYIKPEVGTLIMFPSWLRHGVMPFFGEGERRTFSANINVTPQTKVSGDHYRKDRT